MIDNLKGKRVILREMEEKDWIDVHTYASQPIALLYSILEQEWISTN
ncbi:hypothetical protein [Lysinibacillus xylanilyticus]